MKLYLTNQEFVLTGKICFSIMKPDKTLHTGHALLSLDSPAGHHGLKNPSTHME